MNKFILTTLISLSAIFTGCSTDNDVEKLVSSEKTNITELYEYYIVRNQSKIQDISSLLMTTSSRSQIEINNGVELIEYLSSLSPLVLDSLANLHKNTSFETEINNGSEITTDFLIKNYSAESVQSIYSFISDYAYIGGHSLSTIEQYTSNHPTIIKEIITNTAAYMDQFTLNRTNSRGDAVGSYCYNKLIANIGESGAKEVLYSVGATIIADIPYVGIAGEIADAGYGLYSTIKDVYDYHNCLATHPS